MLKSIPVMIVVVASITTSVVAQSQNQSRNPAEALSRLAQDECTFHIDRRTKEIELLNNTSIGAEIWFVQGLDTLGAPNQDFIEDTGVFVGGTNMPGNNRAVADPCYAGGGRKPIQANICKGSVKMTNGQTHNMEDMIADSGQYWIGCGWVINYASTAPATADGARQVVVRPMHRSAPKTQRGAAPRNQ